MLHDVSYAVLFHLTGAAYQSLTHQMVVGINKSHIMTICEIFSQNSSGHPATNNEDLSFVVG